jgi:hypothetical protein
MPDKSVEFQLGELSGKMDRIIEAWDGIHERFGVVHKMFGDDEKRMNAIETRITVIETRTKTALAILCFVITILFGGGAYYHYQETERGRNRVVGTNDLRGSSGGTDQRQVRSWSRDSQSGTP